MADWNGLRNYIKANYKILEDGVGGTLSLRFHFEDGRTQTVYVGRQEVEGREWASISTIVCGEADLDPRDALLRNGNLVAGHLALIEDGPVIFKHSFPLADLDPSDFEQPLRAVVFSGDILEQELTGRDRF
jgi:hypothetical protein